MTERGHQKLEVEVKGKGFKETAKESEQLDDAQKKLTERMEAAKESFEDTGKKLEKLGDASKGVRRFFEDVADFARRTSEPVRGLGGHISSLSLGIGKLVLALKATSVAWRALPAVGAIVQGVLSIVSVLRQEVAERLRLAEVMKIQGKAQDELLQKQLSQQQRLQDIAGQRRIGGFKSVEALHRAQAMATRAQEQFTRLSPGAIDLVFGTFGDIEGLTQRQLTDMAILAHEDKLQDLNRNWSQSILEAYLKNKRRREGETIEAFAKVGTRLGAGMGRPEHKTGQPTVKAQRAFMETMTPAGGEAMLRERLAELLPPEADIDLAIKLIKLFQTPGELESARKEAIPGRPLTTLMNRYARIRSLVEVGLEDQPGFGALMWEALGLTAKFEMLGAEEYDKLLSAFEQVQKEGRPGAGFDRTPAAAQQPVTIIQNDNRVDNRGAWQTFSDPAAQRRAVRGSDYIIETAER